MIVVVIIGILAAVAIPSYQGFQNKAKTSEAKTFLASIRASEKAFHAEWQSYTSDLVAAGLGSEYGKYYNKIGFTSAATGITVGGSSANNYYLGQAGTCSVTTRTTEADCISTANNQIAKVWTSDSGSEKPTGTGCTVTANAFRACAEPKTTGPSKLYVEASGDITPYP